ncbi:hypothetical protein QYF36_014372 [Acer negundo]|nr:hypothetical protein QYF36_014372 [Acer negundo]
MLGAWNARDRLCMADAIRIVSQGKYLRDIQPGSGSSPRPVCSWWPNPSRTLASSRTHFSSRTNPPPAMPDVRGVTNFPLLKSCTPSCKCAFNRVLSQDNTHPTPTLCLLVELKCLASERIPCLLFRLTQVLSAHQGSRSSPRPVCAGWPNPSHTLASSRTHSSSGTNPPPAMPDVRGVTHSMHMLFGASEMCGLHKYA